MKNIVLFVSGLVCGLVLCVLGTPLVVGLNSDDLAAVTNAEAVTTAYTDHPTRMDKFEYYSGILNARYPGADMREDLEIGMDIAKSPRLSLSLDEWFGQTDYKYSHP